jgi:hypothetical protein
VVGTVLEVCWGDEIREGPDFDVKVPLGISFVEPEDLRAVMSLLEFGKRWVFFIIRLY